MQGGDAAFFWENYLLMESIFLTVVMAETILLLSVWCGGQISNLSFFSLLKTLREFGANS